MARLSEALKNRAAQQKEIRRLLTASVRRLTTPSRCSAPSRFAAFKEREQSERGRSH